MLCLLTLVHPLTTCPSPSHHLRQVLVGLGLVSAALLRRHFLALGGQLAATLARVHVRGVVLVEPLAREVVPLVAALALDVVLPGFSCFWVD